MTANSSIILTSLDFDTNKEALKEALRSQERFADYDFDGSNINVLLDIMSYTTFNNSFYLSQIGNEMFLDSAEMRDSVVSHAKELNYTPRSFKSASALINLKVTTSDTTLRTMVIPKGFTFSSKMLNKSYTFSVAENILLEDYSVVGNTLVFTSPSFSIHEGYYVTDNFTYTGSSSQRFVISNDNVDASSISVIVVEGQGSSVTTYNKAASLFDIDSTSEVFFVQGAENSGYEIVFGDGVSGKKPNLRSSIVVEYRISNGQIPNGCNEFKADSTINGSSNIVVTTVSVAAGGDVSESLESIKFNAPRHFAAQERAVTPEDYESLLKTNFPEVNAVAAYGGEVLTPPQYGKVFLAVDLREVDGLPDSKRQEFYTFLRPRSVMTPMFVDPEYTYIKVNTLVNYNINITSLSMDDIKTVVKSAIVEYAQVHLNNFNKTFRMSPFVNAIDKAQTSIISNETTIQLVKKLIPNGTTFDVKFLAPLEIQYLTSGSHAVYSSAIVYNGVRSIIRDNGQGRLNIVSASGNAELADIGSVNYQTGLLQISSLVIDAYEGETLRFYATPAEQDITITNNVLLNIVDEDVTILVKGKRND